MTTATAPHTCADCQQRATDNEGVTWWRLNTDRRSVRLVAVCRECAIKRDAAKAPASREAAARTATSR